MRAVKDVHEKIKTVASKRILFLPHAIQQMSLPSRMISGEEVEDVVWNGEVIENYPEDLRGHSCLMLGYGEIKRAVHVVCAPRDEYLAIITAYLPDPAVWSEDFRRRNER